MASASLKARLIRAAAVIAVALAVWALWLSQARTGAVTGVCLDSQTNKPIAHAHIWISRTDSPADSGTPASGDDDATDALGGASAPYGWSQSSASDAEKPEINSDSLQARCDADGHFYLPNVPAGDYTVYASARGYEGNDGEAVTIGVESTVKTDISLVQTGSSMNFSDPTEYWQPDKDVILGLNGRLADPNVSLTLDRVDLDGTIARNPGALVSEAGVDGDAATWPGEFTKVKSWPLEFKHLGDYGDFYKRVHVGPLPAGFYRISATSPEASAEAWIVVTHLALIRKTYQNHVLTYVTDMAGGTPVPDVPVTLYLASANPSVIAATTGGPDGLAHLDVHATPEESQGVLLARQGASIAAVTMELNSPGAQSDGQDDPTGDYSPGALRSFIYTERPIYRPGQTVYFKGIARIFQMLAGDTPNLAVPANQNITVDIKDPQDNVVSHQVLKTNAMGSWNGSVSLSTEALTGEYAVHAEIGGQTSDGTFVVAAYHKPEYKVDITFDKKRYVRGDTIHATIAASYYFGAPVAGATVTYDVNSGSGDADDEDDEPQPYKIPGDAPAPDANAGESVVTGTARLDDHGEAHIVVPTKVATDVSQDAVYNFNATVTDSSKRSVDAQASATVGQGEFSLDLTTTPYCTSPGGSVSITVAAANDDQKPLAGQPVEIVTAYQAWVNNTERLSDIHTQNATTGSEGKISLSTIAPHGGLLLIEAKSRDKRGNAIEEDSTVWVSAEDAEVETQYPNMAVLLDRPKYKIGDTAHMLINTQHPGPGALVTIEGATLYKAWVVPLTHRSTSVDIPVTADLAPGVTISACGIYDSQYMNSQEKLVIDDTRRTLQVHVSVPPKIYRAGDPATIDVQTTDAAGKPAAAEVSLGVVDSSIYAIKEDDDRSLVDIMMPDQGNVVNTDYSCPTIYLGDVDKGSIEVKLRSNFRDTAYWMPDVMTDASGHAAVRFTLPDNLTTWRVTATGQTLDTRVGKGTCAFTVTKDLIVRLEPPAFLVARDKSAITGVVNNNTQSPFDATVTLGAAGLSVDGALTQTVAVPAGGSANLTWTVSGANAGDVDLRLTATANTLSDGVEQPLTIIPHSAHSDIWLAGSLTHFADRNIAFEPGAQAASSTLRIRLSSTASAALIPAWQYLAQYPYGSTDATASTLIGNSILSKNLGAIMPSGGDPVTQAATAHLPDEIQRGVLRLARFQKDDGGWGWFDTDREDLWMSSYAAWSLELARDSGARVSPSLISGAMKSIEGSGTDWRIYFDDAPSGTAMAALALAQGGDVAGAEKRLGKLQDFWKRSPNKQTQIDMAVAALAAHHIGGAYDTLAQEWMSELWANRLRLGVLTAWEAQPPHLNAGAEQSGADLDTTIWVLLAAEALTPRDARIDSVARWIMANRTGDNWCGPRSTALSLLALGQYFAASHEMQPDFMAHVVVNGKPVKDVRFGPDSAREPELVIDVPGTALQASNAVHIEKSGPGRLYWSLDLQESRPVGTPQPPPGTFERWYDRLWHPERLLPPFDPSGYRIKRVYLRDTSRRNFLWEDTVPTPAQDFNTGDDIIVRLIIDASRPASHLIVEEPVPAGCMISEVSGDETDDWENWWDYTDVRDDKIVFFIGNQTRGRHEIDYHLRAATSGAYDVMPTSITGTFDPTLHALGGADRITIQ